MSYLSIENLESDNDQYITKNDLIIAQKILSNKIDNIESKMDAILYSMNSLIKYNTSIDKKLNYIMNKIDKELFTEERSSKENKMNLSKRSEDKELFTGQKVEENTMNLSKRSEDKELFSGERSSKENTMNLSKRSEDKELFSGERSSKENTDNHCNSDLNKYDIEETKETKKINETKEINEIKKINETSEINEIKEKKLNNYRSLISSGVKLHKSPGRIKNRSTERLRFKIDEIQKKDTINLSERISENKIENKELFSEKKMEENTYKDKELSNEIKIKDESDNLERKKKVTKNIERYKDIKREVFNLDKSYVKKCLNETCIEDDIKIFKKIYIENVPKEYYPIRNFRKKLQYWLDGHMNDDICGNYIKDTLINNIESCYINVNKYEDYEDDTEQFMKNQEYISKMNEQKYKDRFLSMIIDIIKI